MRSERIVNTITCLSQGDWNWRTPIEMSMCLKWGRMEAILSLWWSEHVHEQARVYVCVKSRDICWPLEVAKDSLHFGCPCASVLTSHLWCLLPALFVFLHHFLYPPAHQTFTWLISLKYLYVAFWPSRHRVLVICFHPAEATSCLPVSFSGCSLVFSLLAVRCFFVSWLVLELN